MLADVEAVGQPVVELDRVGQQDPLSVGKVLSPGDPGDGVGGEVDRVGEGGEGDPGDRGVVDDIVPARVLDYGRVRLGLGDCLRRPCEERPRLAVVLDRCLAEGPIIP